MDEHLTLQELPPTGHTFCCVHFLKESTLLYGHVLEQFSNNCSLSIALYTNLTSTFPIPLQRTVG